MQVFSYGNTKLPKHTLIVNLTSATNCPSEQLGFCKCNDTVGCHYIRNHQETNTGSLYGIHRIPFHSS